MNRNKINSFLYVKTVFKIPIDSFIITRAFLVAQTVNDLAFNSGVPGSIPGLGRSPGERGWLPTPVFLSG